MPITIADSQSPIIERIKKLMALADRATNEHEAALASERMQSLLQEHNLTRAEIESSAEKDAAPADAKREKLTHDRSALYQYQRDLMSTIARNNFCLHWIWTHSKPNPNGRHYKWDSETNDYIKVSRSKVHVLVGRSENVSATVLMYDYLIEAMNRLLPFEGTERRSTDARLWLAGCAETLCERLTAQRSTREKKDPFSNAAQTPGLIRLSDLYSTEEDMNIDFKRGLEPGTTTRRRLEAEAEEAAIKTEIQRLVKGGMDAHAAWYVAHDYGEPYTEPEQIVKDPPKDLPNETSSVIRKRMEADERRWRRESNAEWRRDRQELLKRNNPSFKAGRTKGKDIGLGGALKESSRKQLKD